jgi:hypothetical protein
MILRKIKELHRLLDTYGPIEHNILGIRYPMDMEKVKRLIHAGKWSVLTYSAHKDSLGSDDLRILPHLIGTQWPMVQTLYSSRQSTSEYSKILTRFTEGKFKLCFEDRDFCEELKTNWDLYYKVNMPACLLFGETNNLKQLKDFVFNELNWPDEYPSEEEVKTKKRQLKLTIDPSPENRYLYDLIDKFEDETYLPLLPDFNLGIYENRILSMLSYRAYMLCADEVNDREEMDRILLQAVNYSHGFDTEDQNVYDSTGGTRTSSSVFNPIKVLFNPYYKVPVSAELKESPEYYIAKKMFDAGQGYTGTAHIEMAAVMDEQLNNPERAWAYLVSAGYWAGINLQEAQPVILKAAIDFCERRNYIEAAEVLKYNYDIMNS